MPTRNALLTVLVVMVLFCGLADPAAAQPQVRITFVGHVTASQAVNMAAPYPSLTVGTIVTGEFTYDPTAANTSVDPLVGTYAGPGQTFRTRIGGFTFAHSGVALQVTNSTFDQVQADTAFGLDPLRNAFRQTLIVTDSDGSVFPSVALPVEPYPELAEFEQATYSIEGYSGPDPFNSSGSYSIDVAIDALFPLPTGGDPQVSLFINFEHFPGLDGILGTPDDIGTPASLTALSNQFAGLGLTVNSGTIVDSSYFPGTPTSNSIVTSSPLDVSFSMPVAGVSVDVRSVWTTSLYALDAANNILAIETLVNPSAPNPGADISGVLTVESTTPIARIAVLAEGCTPGPVTSTCSEIVSVDNLVVSVAASANLLQNGNFDQGTANWLTFATPDVSYMPFGVTNGTFEFTRLAPPTGTSNQATIFQNTGVAVGADTALFAQFDLANSSTVRKRISVLVLDGNFADLAVCTFWLPAGSPLRAYGLRTHSTQAWTDASIYFYAATTGAAGGAYHVDNVSLVESAAGSTSSTACIDPTTPLAPGGADGSDLVVNGTFGTGSLAPWGIFGTITQQITAGVFEFMKPSSAVPSGVVLQATGQPLPANDLLTATFELGNSSAVRKRVTAILHDNDFSDLSACTFWLEPGQPLSSYTYRTFTTEAWTNATFSVYPATVGAETWIQLDNVTLQRTPGATIAGTECVEPVGLDAWVADSLAGSGAGRVNSRPAARSTESGPNTPASEGFDRGTSSVRNGTAMAAPGEWIADGFVSVPGLSPTAAAAWESVAIEPLSHILQMATPFDLAATGDTRLHFESWLEASDSVATVQVTTDGVTWETIHRVGATDTWIGHEVDLTAFAGGPIQIRFVFEASTRRDASAFPAWRLGSIRIE